MSKLTSEKRNRLALLALVTTAAISLYWILVVRVQKEWLIENRAVIDQTRQKLAINQRNAGKLPQFRRYLESQRRCLDENEATMASGDVYRWLVDTFATRQSTNGVSNLDVGSPRLGEVAIFPKLPYQEAAFLLTGKAYYHDFGQFVANLENDFPYMRLRRLELEPAHAGKTSQAEAEKLLFKMELTTLVKPGPDPVRR